MRTSLRAALALALLLSPAAGAAARAQVAQRGITAEDYYAFEFLSDPRLSPDGRRVAVTIRDPGAGSEARTPASSSSGAAKRDACAAIRWRSSGSATNQE